MLSLHSLVARHVISITHPVPLNALIKNQRQADQG